MATLAFILLVTSILLPWWTVRVEQGGEQSDRVDLQLWDSHVIARESLMRAALVAVGVAVLMLFVRVAAASWKHEPDKWRRDLAIVLGLATVAVILPFFWPTGMPDFWNTIHARVGEDKVVETARPGLGWWTCLLAVVLLGAARLAARIPHGEPSPTIAK
jgi:amino acid transporter